MRRAILFGRIPVVVMVLMIVASIPCSLGIAAELPASDITITVSDKTMTPMKNAITNI